MILLWITVWMFASLNLWGSKLLKNILVEGKWEELPKVFLDDSYHTLKNYFAGSKSLKIMTSKGNKLIYKAKFEHQGEIGVITFDFVQKTGKYSRAAIKNQIRPLYFIEKFKRYKAANIRLTLGDAQLHFISGYFYETIPFPSLLMFKGKWTFYIKPGDREEQLTLNRIYKREHFSQLNNSGIFILPEKNFLEKLTPEGEVKTLDKESQSLFKMYRDAYGIRIKQFDEYWYLPFPQGTHLVIFKKDKESFYYYSYNENLSPDTRLSESKHNDMILNYNFDKGMKLSFGEVSRVSRMNLSIFFNPKTNFLSGTTSITYSKPTSYKSLNLANGLNLAGNLNLDARGLNIFRKRDTYYLLGAEDNILSLYFRGQIRPVEENFEMFRALVEEGSEESITRENLGESFYFLSKTDNFYPNPGDEFFETHITVTVPGQLNCLASGYLLEKTEGDPRVFKFRSPSSKGISMVTGNFSLVRDLEAQIPLRFYIQQESKFPGDLDLEEIQEGFNFFRRLLGPLDLPAINILLKPAQQEGGVSNNGFIIVNFFERRRSTMNAFIVGGPKIDKKILSPVLIRESIEDYLLHELAHQWWGGVISWKSYRDNWITEGLAHFSVLYYLKKKLPEKQFNRIIKKIKRWVYRFSETGPIIYGTRIRSLENRYEPYQSVVYNKTALVFFMALEMLGEEDFNRRLQSVLEEFKYQSISSMQFLRHFCNNNPMLLDFFKKWIYSRAIPEVELRLDQDDPAFDIREFKQVALSISQISADSDFIFPLQLKVTTREGSSLESVVLKEKVQKIIIRRNSPIRTITIEDDITPVKEKRTPQPRH
jgi:hypothetical protein